MDIDRTQPFIWTLTGLEEFSYMASELFCRGGPKWFLVVKTHEDEVFVDIKRLHKAEAPVRACYTLTIRNQVCARVLVLSAGGRGGGRNTQPGNRTPGQPHTRANAQPDHAGGQA